MGNITEHFIKDSDNVVTLTLSEDGSAIASDPTEIELVFFKPYSDTPVLTLTRSPQGDGLMYASGVLEVIPSDLTEDLSALVEGRLYRIEIAVETAQQLDGVVFGGADSDNKLYFQISKRA